MEHCRTPRQTALPAFQWDRTTQCCRAFTLALARLSCKPWVYLQWFFYKCRMQSHGRFSTANRSSFGEVTNTSISASLWLTSIAQWHPSSYSCDAMLQWYMPYSRMCVCLTQAGIEAVEQIELVIGTEAADRKFGHLHKGYFPLELCPRLWI